MSHLSCSLTTISGEVKTAKMHACHTPNAAVINITTHNICAHKKSQAVR